MDETIFVGRYAHVVESNRGFGIVLLIYLGDTGKIGGCIKDIVGSAEQTCGYMETTFLRQIEVDHTIILHHDIRLNGDIGEVYGLLGLGIAVFDGAEIETLLIRINVVQEIVTCPYGEMPAYGSTHIGRKPVHEAAGHTYAHMVEDAVGLLVLLGFGFLDLLDLRFLYLFYFSLFDFLFGNSLYLFGSRLDHGV